MKKLFLTLFTLCLFNTAFCSQFFLQPELSLKYGTTNEYLYAPFNNAKTVSLLQWEQKPVLQAGITAGLNLNNFTLQTSFLAGMPFNCGNMQDSDWATSDPELKTSYSEHENKIKADFYGAVKTEYNYAPLDHFALSPLFAIEFTYTSFTASQSQGYHGSSAGVAWNSPLAKYVKVSGIDYTFTNLSLLYGLSFKFNVNQKFNFALTGIFTPFEYTQTLDHHRDDFGKNRDFFEKSNIIGFYNTYQGIIYAAYNINNKTALTAQAKLIYSLPASGKMYYKNLKTTYQLDSQDLGTSRKLLSTTFGCNFYL